jgi:UDP-glucose 4,6-dehydratase
MSYRVFGCILILIWYSDTPRNILLTGGAGFIGSNVLSWLLERYPQYRIICLDKFNACASYHNLASHIGNENFHCIKGDVCDSQLIVRILKEYHIDTILHFAAETHVDNSFGDSLPFTESNILGTHVLLESVKNVKRQIGRFIHVSTDEVYGEVPLECKNRCTVQSPLAPSNPYAATKTAAEYMVKSYNISFQLPTIITRSNNVFGPRQYPEKLIPKFITLLKKDQPCPLHGT